MSRRKRKGNRRASVAEVYGRLGPAPVKVKEPEASFEVENNDVTECSRALIGEVHISSELWYRLIALCQHFDHEWMGFLIGQIENDVAVVEDIYFPPQEVGKATVDAIEEAPEYRIRPNTIGAIHSHVSMAARFSKTDEEHANWPLEIVINNRAEYQATLRLEVPCGFFIRGRALIHLGTDSEVEQMVDHIENGIRIGLRVRPPKPKGVITSGTGQMYTPAGTSHADKWKAAVDQWEGM
jgi:proteasome lid subunit RPN8/RPN11